MIYKRENFVEENSDSRQFPVKQVEQMSAIDGSSTKFVGRVSLGLETPMGVQTMPVVFEIEADTIEDAFAQFETRAEDEVERAKKELENQMQELRRQSQNRIVTPDEIAPGGLSKLQI